MQKTYLEFWHWAPSFILIALGLIGANLVWLIPTINTVRVSASNLALEIADRVEKDTTLYLEDSLGEMENVAEEIALDPERTTLILGRFLNKNSGFRNIAMVGRGGKETVRVDRFHLVSDKDLKDHALAPHFYLALEGAPSFGDIFLSEEFEPQTTLAVPVRRFGKPEGVLVAQLNLRALVLATQRPRLDGHVYIVDHEGFQVVHPDITEILRRPNFSNRKAIEKVIVEGKVVDGLGSEDSYTNENGERVFVVGKPLPLARLGIFVEQPRSAALAAERQVILFAIATVILGLVLLIFIVRSNTRLTVLNTRLRELDVVKSEFVSVAAHQLRTPLTGIKWTLSTLLEEAEKFTGEQKKIINDAFSAAGRLTELINDLLSVARIEEGRFGFKMALQSLTPLVQDIALGFKKLSLEKGIDFSVIVPERIPTLLFDEDKIRIVVENFLDNAIKYTAPGGKVVFTVDIRGDEVVFSVKDTGIGIPADQAHRIFAKFFRSANAQLYQTSGTGLGLYVCKNIVEEHGGKIWFESEEDRGSTFYFTLPISK